VVSGAAHRERALFARARAANHGLPDSILAVLRTAGPDGSGRAISRAGFLRAWSRTAPPTRPDSLTPAGARGFLELLLDKEALALMAARERWAWTAPESAAFEALRDRLVVRAMLDSALAEAAAGLGAGSDSLDRQTLGIAARDRAMARIGPVFDDSLLARLARAFAALERPTSDSSLSAQLRMLAAGPRVDPADTGRVVARSRAGDYGVSDLLAAWTRLSPLYRPRVETAEQVRELAMNGLFERELRRAGRARRLDRRPDLAAELESRRELNDVSHLIAREVHAGNTADSLTLLRFHRSTEREWTLPTRVRLVRMVLETRSGAEAMAQRLRDAAEAESLAARARRSGLEWAIDLSAESDSALFARALRTGTGTVLGPDEAAGGWAVARVVAVLPGRVRPFGEVRDLVRRRWQEEQAERLTRALAARARRGLRLAVNEAALEALLWDPPAELRVRPE